MPFDLSTRKPKDTVTVIVKDPATNADTDARITLHALYSPEAIAAKFALADRTEADKAEKAGNPQGAAERERRLAELLAACTVGWENVHVDGAALAFSTEAATTLYLAYPWLYEQLRTRYFEADAFFADAGTRS